MVKIAIKNISEPIIFIALKRICKYLVNNAWETVLLGNEEGELEYKLALAKTKKYKSDIELLANIDTDFNWGEKKIKTPTGYIITKDGDFNPWYKGKLTLDELLDSLKEFADILDNDYIDDVEFIHYFNFLKDYLAEKNNSNEIDFWSLVHPNIKSVTKSRFDTEHYPDAVEAAFKAIIRRVKYFVKHKTGQDLEGDRAINKAFACETQEPVIKVNTLTTREEKDEQTGIYYLFKGVVFIRNRKAHDEVILNNSVRARGYILLASLLMSLLDEYAK
jgi:uncharacterized protein (TIGR02391 family)